VEPSPVGRLLQHWRAQRRLSQLALATEAGVTPRHVSYVESGRANPSREMVLTLARALDVPLRERNQVLLAAGSAPQHRETGLDDASMAELSAAFGPLREHVANWEQTGEALIQRVHREAIGGVPDLVAAGDPRRVVLPGAAVSPL
jgi:transcriptional regulator with XRE-family HTH domain